MRKQPKGSPALKHGGYSGLTLLPGENRFAFEKLRRELFDELKPQGRLEQEIVTDIARLTWRKQNLGNYQNIKLAQILADILTTSSTVVDAQAALEDFVKSVPNYKGILEAEHRVKAQEQNASEAEAERFFKERDIMKMATLEGLMRELEVEDRLGAMIERCIKRLVLLRGLKSLDRSPKVASPPAKIALMR
jgi:hypothetical protein